MYDEKKVEDLLNVKTNTPIIAIKDVFSFTLRIVKVRVRRLCTLIATYYKNNLWLKQGRCVLVQLTRLAHSPVLHKKLNQFY